MSLALHHMIQRAEPCSAGWHFMFLQYPSEYIHSLGGQRDGAVPAQAVQYFGRRQPFSLLVISGNAEIVVEQLLFGRYLFEIVVVFRHNPFVRLVEPIAFAVVQFVHGLGIKLVVVYRAVGVYCFRHFYADEPATAAGSVSKSFWLLVAMNEAYRRISSTALAYGLRTLTTGFWRICFRNPCWVLLIWSNSSMLMSAKRLR